MYQLGGHSEPKVLHLNSPVAPAMSGRTTIVVALGLVIGGAILRFYHYYVIEQYLLKLVIAISIVLLAGSLILRSKSEGYKNPVIFAVVVVMLCVFAYESPASNRLKNQKYAERLSGVINRYYEKNHITPSSFDEALAVSGETMQNRGDADGNPFLYLRMSNRIYILRIFGPNRQNDFGSGDDIQLNYVNGNPMSFERLLNWIETSGTQEEREALEVYGPVLRGS